MPIFCRFTIFMFAPDAIFLLLHDISESTEMPSFVAPRYLWFHRVAIFWCTAILLFSSSRPSFNAPRYLWFHHDLVSEIFLTPLLCCGATSRLFGLKIMPPSPRQHQHGVRNSLPFTTNFLPEFKYSFCLFPTLLFALSLFEFYTAYQNRAQFLIFVADTTYQIRARFFIFVELLFCF